MIMMWCHPAILEYFYISICHRCAKNICLISPHSIRKPHPFFTFGAAICHHDGVIHGLVAELVALEAIFVGRAGTELLM